MTKRFRTLFVTTALALVAATALAVCSPGFTYIDGGKKKSCTLIPGSPDGYCLYECS